MICCRTNCALPCSSTQVSPRTLSRKTPFQVPHSLQYGLLVVAKDISGAVSCVQCQFCQYLDPKRLSTGKESGPLTVELQTSLSYSLTLRRTCHPLKWSDYQGLIESAKAIFQVQKKVKAGYKHSASQNQIPCSSHFRQLLLMISLVKFYNSNDEDDPVGHALWGFGSKRIGMYYVVINTPLRFKLAKHLSVGYLLDALLQSFVNITIPLPIRNCTTSQFVYLLNKFNICSVHKFRLVNSS
ncbi:hypothetical protein PHMEG_00035583 [Phytophthora megakarya]|uniref:Uncharacterized protein n=1 Tax=Phytophthora megakarya TaxID=4795 RepID=A0A225UNP7_9STRA|nr:hypothetical protein PHMEG_00035583 [Phytophthora megakarya]